MRSAKAANSISVLWLPLALALSVPAYLWHQNYFRSTGPYFTLVRALPLLCLAALAYAVWLRPAIRRYELALLLLVPFALCCTLQPVAMLATVCIALGALGLGDCLTPLMAFEAEDLAVAWTCGFGLLILAAAGLGKLGFLSPAFVGSVLVLSCSRALFVWGRLSRWLLLPFRKWRESQGLASPAAGICIFFLGFFVCCSLLLVLTPVTAFDVTLYHFPLAQHYARTHSVQPIPSIPESFFPQGTEVLMALAFTSLAGEPAARFLVAALGVLFLWVLVSVGRCCGLRRSAAVSGAAIAATLPFIHWTFSVPKNDSALALFQLTALYSFLQWLKGRGARWLLLLAFLLGQTVGIKHVALFGLVGVAPLCLYAWAKERFSWRLGTAAAAIFLATGVFWHIQTWILTGDPAFPRMATEATSTPNKPHGPKVDNLLGRYATLPWYLLFHGQKAFESPSPNPLGMFCFLFIPAVLVGLCTTTWNAPRVACFCFALLYVMYWCSILSTLRYAIVPFGLLALAIGAALVRLLDTPSRAIRAAVLSTASYGFLFSLIVVISISVNSSQASVILKRITQEEYLGESTPAVRPLFWLAHRFPNAPTFGVDTCARYYAPDPLQFSCTLCSEGCELNDVLNRLRSQPFEFAIVPSSPQFQSLVDAIVAKYGATIVDNEDQFVTLRLHSTAAQTR